MFGLFKKRALLPSPEEVQRIAASARQDIKSKWIFFNQTIHLKAEVPLSQKIDMFAQPLREFIKKKYPLLLMSGEIFWLTVLSAILESGTHTKEAVNRATEELQSKYGPR